MFNAIISSMRVEQWYKNLVIFVGITFSMNITNLSMLSRTVVAFSVFCALSSGVYIINDINDIERDRLHPKKKNRPIASGKISINVAWLIAFFFITSSFTIALFLGTFFWAICLIYLIQNFLYNFWFKKIAIVDVAVVSTGFVWRAIAGTIVIGVRTSPWLIICSFLLALYLALLKRKLELTTLDRADQHRLSLSSYSNSLIDNFITITITSLLVAYMIYTFESNHVYMMATIPSAFIGIFRYLQLSSNIEDNDSPTFILQDRFTQVNLLIWVVISLLALYDIPSIFLT